MRPPEFTGGNRDYRRGPSHLEAMASMRPPEFTGGNKSWRLSMLQLKA